MNFGEYMFERIDMADMSDAIEARLIAEQILGDNNGIEISFKTDTNKDTDPVSYALVKITSPAVDETNAEGEVTYRHTGDQVIIFMKDEKMHIVPKF